MAAAAVIESLSSTPSCQRGCCASALVACHVRNGAAPARATKSPTPGATSGSGSDRSRNSGLVELECQPECIVDLVHLGPADVAHEGAEAFRRDRGSLFDENLSAFAANRDCRPKTLGPGRTRGGRNQHGRKGKVVRLNDDGMANPGVFMTADPSWRGQAVNVTTHAGRPSLRAPHDSRHGRHRHPSAWPIRRAARRAGSIRSSTRHRRPPSPPRTGRAWHPSPVH